MKEKLLRSAMRAYDILSIAVSCFIAFKIGTFGEILLPEAYMSLSWLIAALVTIYLFALNYFNIYDMHTAVYHFRILPAVFKSTLLTFAIFNFLSFFVVKYPASRRFLLSFFAIAPFLLVLRNKFIIFISKIFNFNPRVGKKVLIVGDAARALQFSRILQRSPFPGMSVTGVITEKKSGKGDANKVWTLEKFEEILDTQVIDEVLFCAPHDWATELNKAIIACSNRGLPFRVYANFFSLILAEANMEEFLGMPLFSFHQKGEAPIKLAAKRIFDIFFSAILLILFSPIFILIALVIKITMPGPILFKQRRSGIDGHEFDFYKFRSMVINAEDLKESLRSQNEVDGPVFKIKEDPRITRFGRLIRKFSIDELPQLWNVLRGDMSIVGPRPPIPAEVKKYEPWQKRRLAMKPGLTCIWQVSGRSNISFDDWMKMDLYYIDNWSLMMDLKIILKTVPVVFTGEGAY